MKKLVGQVLDGKVSLLALIGEGGMGAVYRGRQLNFDREVAVKVMKPQFLSSEDLVRRFYREARAAGRLRSRHVISIYDYGRAPEGAYIIMELSNGESLADILYREKRLAPVRAVNIIAQILSALAEAHSAGVVHRDLKTDNILIEKDFAGHDFALVLDFGIAKLSGSFSVQTMDGSIFGTPSYMAPEQCRGDSADSRADLYAAGIMLYEMLTGETPFGDKAGTDLLLAHIREPPPSLHQLRPDLPARLCDLVMKLLEKDREHRPQTADLARTELLAAMAAEELTRAPVYSFEDTIADLTPIREEGPLNINLDLVPELQPRARGPATLSAEQWNLLALIGADRKSIRELAAAARIPPVDAAQKLRTLIGRGMLRLAPPTGATLAREVDPAVIAAISEALAESLGPVSQHVIDKEITLLVKDGEALRDDQLETLLERIAARVRDPETKKAFLRRVRDALAR